MSALGDAIRAKATELEAIALDVDAMSSGGAPPPVIETVVEVAPGDGTRSGNITGDGGIVRLFSGAKTGHTNGGGASFRQGVTSGYGSAAFSVPKRIDNVKVYGCSDVGLWHTGNPQVTVAVYAKMGAQSSPTDGTLLGTTTVTDANGVVVTVPSSDKVSAFDYLSVVISQPGSAANLWVAGIIVSEIVTGPAPTQTVAIVSPVPNRVFQHIGGVASFGVDWRGSADAVRLSRVSDGAIIAENATGDFTAVPTGWYELSLLSGGVVRDKIKMGVGDVYVVKGQSNGVSQVQGSGWVPVVPPPGRVIVSDYYAQGMHAFRDPAERPLLNNLDAGAAWLYAGLALNRPYPVMFVIVAQGNTSTAVWASAPYIDRAVTAAVLFKPKAVLWLQGESDAGEGFSQAQSYANMHALITAVNGAAPNLPWVVALNSSAPAYSPIRAAQQQIDAAFANVHIGPDTDQYRAGQVEFLGDSLRLVGEAFAARLLALGL